MKSLAIIPARAGSKRLPKKNKLHLDNKPLIMYTIDAVLKSNMFDKIILSTNDSDIIQIGKKIKGITAEDRDEELSGDFVKVIDLVYKIINRDDIKNNYDKVGLFLPTCPFRDAKHIIDAVKLLRPDDYSVVSVTEMNDPVQLCVSINQNNVINSNIFFNPSPLVTGNTRSQDFQTYHRVNGGIYFGWIDKLLAKENFFQGKVKAYVMDRLDSIDIDNKLDFEWAEYLIKNEYVKIGEK